MDRAHCRSMPLECQNKYFPYGPKSRSIRALLYTYTNKIVYDEILLSWSDVYCVSALPGPYAGPYAYVGIHLSQIHLIRSKNSFRISIKSFRLSRKNVGAKCLGAVSIDH